ncbi:MAG TPA: asparagine--tRNA ligase [Bdellovibrionota bacterium]|nr:asparagine--tRNA ligase [Bdellovibrionota bacterium]
MEIILIKHAGEFVGREVQLQGWVYNTRSSGKVKFLVLRDGTGYMQCVYFKGNLDEATFTRFDQLTQESSVIVTGKIKPEPRAPGGFELDATGLEIIQIAQNYPITPKEHGDSFLFDNRHLHLRSSKPHAILRIRHHLIKAIRDFFDRRDFTLVDTPIFTPSACEGTTTLFEVNYFDTKAYLTQSGQLYNEANAMALKNVYCFGPTFRAEKSKTRRHLIEFWMVEPEMAFCDLKKDMEVAEQFVEYIVQWVVEHCKTELETLERNIEPLKKVKAPFPRVHYKEAAKILEKAGTGFVYGGDFGAPDETVISNQFDKPVFITNFPMAVKAFYMKQDPEDPTLTLSADLLAPEGFGEIIGGGQREENIDTLLKQIEKHKLKREDFEWYLDLRKYGSVPHAGFGLGIERTLAWICGLDHIREAIPYPRMLYRMRP